MVGKGLTKFRSHTWQWTTSVLSSRRQTGINFNDPQYMQGNRCSREASKADNNIDHPIMEYWIKVFLKGIVWDLWGKPKFADKINFMVGHLVLLCNIQWKAALYPAQFLMYFILSNFLLRKTDVMKVIDNSNVWIKLSLSYLTLIFKIKLLSPS